MKYNLFDCQSTKETCGGADFCMCKGKLGTKSSCLYAGETLMSQLKKKITGSSLLTCRQHTANVWHTHRLVFCSIRKCKISAPTATLLVPVRRYLWKVFNTSLQHSPPMTAERRYLPLQILILQLLWLLPGESVATGVCCCWRSLWAEPHGSTAPSPGQ